MSQQLLTRLKQGEPPPPDYYANLLLLICTDVLDLYGDILNKEEAEFGKVVSSMGADCRRLLARLCTRKNQVLRQKTLNYQEIESLKDAIQEISDQALVSFECGDTSQILNAFAASEIKAIFEMKGQWRKPELIAEIEATYPNDDVIKKSQDFCTWLYFCGRPLLDVYRLLYFGNPYEDLTAFILRDLGVSTFEDYLVDKSTRIFSNRMSLVRYVELFELRQGIYEQGTEWEATALQKTISQLRGTDSNRYVERVRSSALNELGRNLERADRYKCARNCYELSTLPPARERLARMANRAQDDVRYKSQIDAITRHPWSRLELEFAQSRGTRFNESELCEVAKFVQEDSSEFRIEQQAISHLATQGHEAYHLENVLPHTLFALAYWDWIFAAAPGSFVQEFQDAPLDIFLPSFFDTRKERLEDPLALSEHALKEKMRVTTTSKRGIRCRFAHWQAISEDLVEKLVQAIPFATLSNILAIMRTDLRQMSAGFPDLTVFTANGSVEFVEVKARTDRLQLNQRIWIRDLLASNVPTKILRGQ